MARMTREQFETAVRVAIAENIGTGTPCSCCGVAEIEGVDDAVKAIGSTFEDAESDAYFAGKDQGSYDEMDRTRATATGDN